MSGKLGTTVDKKAILRDKRAQGIVAMGLVTRDCDRFRVGTPSLRGRTARYEVWRDGSGIIRCSCLEYEEQANDNPGFRCEHILAVKHSLVAKNSEALGKPIASTVESAPRDAGGASESVRPEAATAGLVQPFAAFPDAAGDESPETATSSEQSAPISNLRSLARTPVVEDQDISRKNGFRSAQTTVNKDQQVTSPAEPDPRVVPTAFIKTLRDLRLENAEVGANKGWTDRQEERRGGEAVKWYPIMDVLDRIVPTWSYSIGSIVQVGQMVAVTAALTIDGVTREGVGTGLAQSAVGIEQAEREALKRAALKFGIGRDIEKSDSGAADEPIVTSAPMNSNPLAKSMADLVTPKQLGMMRRLARDAGLSVEDECQSIYGCTSGELSRNAASAIIIHLQGLPKAASAGMRRAS